jgi:hypothetical protein
MNAAWNCLSSGHYGFYGDQMLRKLMSHRFPQWKAGAELGAESAQKQIGLAERDAGGIFRPAREKGGIERPAMLCRGIAMAKGHVFPGPCDRGRSMLAERSMQQRKLP